MLLNADVIYQNIKNELSVSIYGKLGKELKLYRPEFYIDKNKRFVKNHVYVCSADHLPTNPVVEENVLLICLGEASQRKKFEKLCGIISIPENEDIFRVFNMVQNVFNKYEAWEARMNTVIRENASLQDLLELSKDIFENPMLLIGADFNYLACIEQNYLQNKIGINFSGPTFDPELLEVFLSMHEIATDIKEPLLLNLMNRETLSINIFDENEYLGCITIFGEFRSFRSSDVELCLVFANALKQAFQLKPHLAGDRASIRRSIIDIISGRPISQEQKEIISKNNVRSSMRCILLKHKKDSLILPVGYVISMIEQTFAGSLAFEYENNITAFVSDNDELIENLKHLINKTKMVCGISNCFTNIYDSTYVYYQAFSALELGTRDKEIKDIYYFEDYILPLLLANSTKGMPTRIFYTQGIERLAKHDVSSAVSYLDTLKAYLENNMSIAETARKLNLHRSSLIDRLGRISTMLDMDLNDIKNRLTIQILLNCKIEELKSEQGSFNYQNIKDFPKEVF